MTQVSYLNEITSPRRVYYTGPDTLGEGYCLCYDRDYGLAASDEIARAYRVEKPAEGNLKYFAGIVGDQDAGKTGPCWVTIVEPRPCPGRLVNIYTDQDCALGVTRLAVQAGSYAAGAAAGNAVTVATAMQTANRSGETGLVLAQLEGALGLGLDAAAAVTQTQTATTDSSTGAAGDELVALAGGGLDALSNAEAAKINSNLASISRQLNRAKADVAAILTALKNANLMAG